MKNIKELVVTVHYTVGTGNFEISDELAQKLSDYFNNRKPIDESWTNDDMESELFSVITDNTINEDSCDLSYIVEHLEMEDVNENNE